MTTTVRPLAGPNPMPGGAYDLADLGYVEEEFLLSGTAESYRVVGERSSDGKWEVEPSDPSPFVTRLLVRRPADAAKFSGTAVVEWFNVSGGLDVGPDWSLLHRHLIRRGHAWVGVSAQKVGIDGGGFVESLHLKKAFPDRYNVLSHPGDEWSFDMFSQAGHALRAVDGSGPLGPLTPVRVLAAGESQSAACLVTYINAVDARAAGVRRVLRPRPRRERRGARRLPLARARRRRHRQCRRATVGRGDPRRRPRSRPRAAERDRRRPPRRRPGRTARRRPAPAVGARRCRARRQLHPDRRQLRRRHARR